MTDTALATVLESDTPSVPKQDTREYNKRLTTSELARILRLKADGLTGPQIAQALGRHHSTIYDALEAMEPTVELARKRLEAGALPAAERWAELAASSTRHDAAKELLLHTGAIEPLPDKRQASVGVRVVLGTPGLSVEAFSRTD